MICNIPLAIKSLMSKSLIKILLADIALIPILVIGVAIGTLLINGNLNETSTNETFSNEIIWLGVNAIVNIILGVLILIITILVLCNNNSYLSVFALKCSYLLHSSFLICWTTIGIVIFFNYYKKSNLNFEMVENIAINLLLLIKYVINFYLLRKKM